MAIVGFLASRRVVEPKGTQDEERWKTASIKVRNERGEFPGWMEGDDKGRKYTQHLFDYE